MVNGTLSSHPLLCLNCQNIVGVLQPNGSVVSKKAGRTIRIERGEITCELCGVVRGVDNKAAPVVG